jgi:hypothetical protein|tara:strand:- start:1855 stop:2709 length:855 start_codon:yes stop_codon:yes gene_type:complete
MENIVGLGTAGCNIAEKFMRYPQYTVYRIDTDERSGEDVFLLPEQESHEMYEKNCPDFKQFFSNIQTSCLLVLGGSGTISGAALRVLQQLSHLDVSVLYVRPETELLSEVKRLQERVVFGILQEYARSAAISKIYLVDNSKIEDILGDIPVIGYHDKINNLIVHTIHMVNIFKNSRSIMNTFSRPMTAARIATFGVMDIRNAEEKLFFDLNLPRERVYYYALNRKKLEEDGGLLKLITQQVRDRTDGGLVKASYGIFATDYDEDYVYSLTHTTMIQSEKNDINV